MFRLAFLLVSAVIPAAYNQVKEKVVSYVINTNEKPNKKAFKKIAFGNW